MGGCACACVYVSQFEMFRNEFEDNFSNVDDVLASIKRKKSFTGRTNLTLPESQVKYLKIPGDPNDDIFKGKSLYINGEKIVNERKLRLNLKVGEQFVTEAPYDVSAEKPIDVRPKWSEVRK